MSEILYSVRTLWEWNDDDNKKIEEECRKVNIEYIKEKQSFEIRGNDYEKLDKLRDDLLKLLNSMSATATQSLIIPRHSKKNKSKSARVDLPPGLPPPLPFEEENIPTMTQEQEYETEAEEGVFRFFPQIKVSDIPNIFGWNRREPFLTYDYWLELCKECRVGGDINDEKKKIVFTKGREGDIEEAIKRLSQLQDNFIRPKFIHTRVPLVHYPNQYTSFKLYFCHLFRHPYFSKTVKIEHKDVYVLVPATLDPRTQKFLLPRDIPESNFQRPYDSNQYDRTENQRQENNIEEERATKGKAKAVSPNNDSPSHNWTTIPRPKEAQWSYNAPDSNSTEAFPALSSNRDQNRRSSNSGRPLPPENPRLENQRARRASSINEGPLIDLEEDTPTIKRSIRQQNPNNETENRTTIGRMVRDYNFAKMKDVLSEGLEYVRVHKGEVRFYGSLGKAYFSKVNEGVKGKLWEFSDLKDILVTEYGVNPKFNEIATYDSNLVGSFIEVLGTNPISKSKIAYYEIKADARNAPQGPYTEVYMYVNMGLVSLEKVMLKREPLVNIDWTILDRKSDFSMILNTRRAIRHDVKPFTTFVKKISVNPNTRWISFENVKDFLEVKSVHFKQVTKFRLHQPFIAEVSRIEKLDISEQPNSIKRIGKTGKNEVYYTIEIYSDQHRELFKQNTSLGSGEISKWTVDDILGASPSRGILVDFVKAMLLLVERCHKAAERSQQLAESQNNNEDR